MHRFPHLHRRLTADEFHALEALVAACHEYLEGESNEEETWRKYVKIADDSRSLILFLQSEQMMANAHMDLHESLDSYEEDPVQRKMYGYADRDKVHESVKNFLQALDLFDASLSSG